MQQAPRIMMRGPIAILERFVVYCSCWLIISGRAPGRGPEGTGNCSSSAVAIFRLLRCPSHWQAGHEYALAAARARRRRTAVAGCCSAADAVNREHHSSESAGGSLGFTPSPALRVRL